jgi:hypothetical protein
MNRTITTKEATEELFNLARRAPFNIAPEQGEKLANEIFTPHGEWSLKSSESEVGFYAIVESKEICLTYAGLASLWCLAYTAYQIIDISNKCQRSKNFQNQTCIDIGEQFNTLNLDSYLSYASSLMNKNLPWQTGLSLPNSQADLGSIDGRINNIFFGALSWIMLHEIGHVHYDDSHFSPVDKARKEEYRADDFATKWILDNAGNGIKREFRILMISVAISWLFLSEKEHGQGQTHPPAILRFKEAVSLFNVGHRSSALENVSYLFKAIFDPSSSPASYETPKECFDDMVRRMEELFPNLQK